VAIGKEGPRTVSAKDHQLYARYVKAIHWLFGENSR
jgi:hypothetical protein